MNILFTRFPLESIPGGGAETQTISLMKGLRDRGHMLSFAGSCPALLTEASRYSLTANRCIIGSPPVTPWLAFSFLWRAPFMRRKLARLLTANRSSLDAIMMLSLTEKLLLTDIAARQGIKVFWIEHDRIGSWLTRNPWLWLLRRQSELATTITVSELSRQKYLELGWSREGTVAIPNGTSIHSAPSRVIPSDFAKQNSIEGQKAPNTQCDTSILHLGCVSRLSPEKGVDLLIEAVKGMPDVKLTIVGRGPETGRLKKTVTKDVMVSLPNHDVALPLSMPKGQGDVFTILPFIEDIQNFYHSIDVFILPSREHDPFGMVAAEAMMCAVPVIVTDQCGIAGYLKNGVDAIIVKAGSSDALRAGAERIKNQELRIKMRQEGQQTAQRLFTNDQMVYKYEKLFLQS